MVKVSIIVPVYNVESYVAMCLDSLVNQTFSDIEIICVNDGSADESLNILEHYKKLDTRIKIVNKENGGLSSARNAGMKVAEGKYILFVDSDDWISTNAIEHLYANAENNNSDLVVFDFVSDDFAKKEKSVMTIMQYKDKYMNEPFNVDSMDSWAYKYIPVSTWSKLYKTDLIKNKVLFFEDMIFEDVPFWAYVYSHATRITYLPIPFYYYRKNREGSIMMNKGRSLFDVIKAYSRVEDILKEAGKWEKCKPSVEILMVMDFLLKYNVIAPELKEEFFNKIKSLNKKIDTVVFDKSNFSKVEEACVKRFNLLNTVDYKTFCETPFEVKYE